MTDLFFDLDGTIADLYGQEDWLGAIRAEDASPFENAQPMVEVDELRALLKKMADLGHEAGVITWLPKGASSSYKKAVRAAKREWINRYFEGCFVEIHIVQYGTPKQSVIKNKNAILFDDEERNRNQWSGLAFTPEEIRKVLEFF